MRPWAPASVCAEIATGTSSAAAGEPQGDGEVPFPVGDASSATVRCKGDPSVRERVSSASRSGQNHVKMQPLQRLPALPNAPVLRPTRTDASTWAPTLAPKVGAFSTARGEPNSHGPAGDGIGAVSFQRTLVFAFRAAYLNPCASCGALAPLFPKGLAPTVSQPRMLQSWAAPCIHREMRDAPD